MARPVITEALELLRAKCTDAPEGAWDPDLVGAWSGAFRGVPDEHIVQAAEAWHGEFPRLTDFMAHSGELHSLRGAAGGGGPSPARQAEMKLSSAARRDRAKEKLAAMRADLGGRSKPPMPHQLEAASR